MMSFLEILCLIVSGTVCFYFYLIRNHNHWIKRGVPGPKARFVMGNLPSILTQKRNGVYDMEDIYSKWKSEANFVGFFNMMQPQIFLLKPELIKIVTVKNFNNFRDNAFTEIFNKDSDPVFTKTIFMLCGTEWKEKRAELAPAFTDSKMKSMISLIEEVSKKLVDYLDVAVDSENPKVLDTRTLCVRYSMDVFGNCAFRIDGKSFVEEKSEMMRMGEETMNPDSSFILSFMLMQFFPVLKPLLHPRFIRASIGDYLANLIKETTEKRRENLVEGVDFMSFMEHLQLNRGTSPAHILGHIFTFLVDSYELSSNFMAHTLYQLAKNPDIQDKLRTEVQSLDMLDCEYLHRVLLESLRINPPLPTISKTCTEECNLPLRDGENILIEKNTWIIIPIYCIQRDAEHYPNPDVFDPDRFLDGNAKKFQNEGIFLPFGDGPRTCMGMKFAMMQVKIGVAAIVKKFHIAVDPKMVDPFELDAKTFTTTAKGGYWLQFKRLEGN